MFGLVAASFGISLGIGVIFPLVPIFARDTGISLAAVGSLVGAFGIARIAIGVISAPLINRTSERAIAAAGAAVVALGSLMTAFADSFATLLAARIVHGLGVALFIAAALVYIGRGVPPTHRARALSTQQAAMLLSTSVGPVVGAVLASIGGIRLPFFFAAAVGAASVVYCARNFPSNAANAASPGAAPGRLPRDWRWTMAVAYIASFATWGLRSAVRFTLTPLFVDEHLGWALIWSGVMLAAMSVGDIVGLAFGGRWMDRYGRRTVLATGLVGSAIAVACIPHLEQAAPLLAVSFGFGLLSGGCSVAPASIAADLAHGRAGPMTGVRLAGDTGVLIGPIAATTVVGASGFAASYATVAVASVVAAIAAATARETSRHHLTVDPNALPTLGP
jgi:MFS transporter, DHA1 family, multidrug resistance protein